MYPPFPEIFKVKFKVGDTFGDVHPQSRTWGQGQGRWAGMDG